MAITYTFDIAPHLRRVQSLRARRNARWHWLHRHDGRAEFWRLAVPACLLFWGFVVYGVYEIL